MSLLKLLMSRAKLNFLLVKLTSWAKPAC
jgi:hypothetical protein